MKQRAAKAENDGEQRDDDEDCDHVHGGHFILPAPMPTRFSVFGRAFAPSWPMTLITLVLLTLFVGLGRWQWQRGEAKQAVWNTYERNDGTPALNAPVNFDSAERFK